MKKKEITEVDGKLYIKSKVVTLDDNQRTTCLGLIKCINPWKSATFPEEDFSNIGDVRIGKNISEGVFEFWKPQNLYFLSDEDIKEGDWIFDLVCKTVWKAKNSQSNTQGFKKIIASTDESLKIGPYLGHYEGEDCTLTLPRPSNEFLRAYCKANGKIDEVLVEVEPDYIKALTLDHSDEILNGFKLKTSPDNTITIKRTKESSLQNFREKYANREKMYGEKDMFLNMQYYHEHCILHGYITPQKWIEEHKHF